MFGVYEIKDTVGQGGMGVVYRAHDTALDRIVALKVLKEDLRSNKQVAARFQREAQAIASLSHPGIVHIYAVGSVGRIPFISMEFIEGLTLSQLMKREKKIAWKRALHIAEQVAEALACAHEAHIIHRDIKPGNVLLAADDRAYVTDFGIAKVLTAETQLTVEGSRLGTPNYMSPERCMNQEITPSSDIYSLGVVMFQMITGRLPYEAASPVELIKKIVSDPPARARDYAPEVPEDVERLVAHLIEKKPTDRPHDAGDVAQMCRRVIEGEPLFEESAIASSLRAVRDQEPSTSTGTTGLGDLPLSRAPFAAVRRVWQETSATARLWTAGVLLIVVAGALGQLAATQTSEDLARQTVSQWDRSPAGWVRSASPAEFTPESQGLIKVKVNLPRMQTTRVLATGASEFVLEFTGGPGGASAPARAIGLLAADPQGMRLVLPPMSTNKGGEPGRLIGAEPGPSPGFEDVEAVFIANGGRMADGPGTAELRYVDASLKDKGYGLALVTANDLVTNNGARARSIELAAVSLWSGDMALVSGNGSEDGHSVFLVTLDSGIVTGRPRVLGGAGPQVRGLQFTRDGDLLVARGTPAGGLNIRQYSRDGNDTMRYSTQDASVALADLTTTTAVILTGSADERVASHIDLRTGAEIRLGDAVAAAQHPDGGRVIVTDADYRGNLQVYSVTLDSQNRVQLTFLTQGVGTQLSISRDGRFAVADLVDRAAPGLVLIALDHVSGSVSGSR